jgi:drug/metabolite transporter (DMT)-like permease
MAIDVLCTKCKTRFQVSEKFAGKSGPCPKCKATIKIPEAKEQVVIHAPETTGTKTATGQPIFTPIKRTEVKLGVPQIALIVGSVLVVLIAAVILRGQPMAMKQLAAIIGAVLLGPPLAFAAYTFLRDDELEPYRGTEVILRSLACGLAFAAIWGAYWLIFAYWYDFKPLPVGQPNWPLMGVVIGAMVAIGALTSQASFELEVTTGALHYGTYLAATILLRLLMGMGPRWLDR